MKRLCLYEMCLCNILPTILYIYNLSVSTVTGNIYTVYLMYYLTLFFILYLKGDFTLCEKSRFGDNIDKHRIMLGLNVTELALRCGIKDNYLSKIIHNHQMPSTDVAVDIANALGVGLSDLLYGIDDENGNSEILHENISLLKKIKDNKDLNYLLDVLVDLKSMDWK